MRIGLHLADGTGSGVGGAELMMAYLGSVWALEHDVDLIHHRPALTHDRLAAFSTDDYSRVNMRYVPREPARPSSGAPIHRYRAARSWHAGVSAGYDLFVTCGHWMPPFCHA